MASQPPQGATPPDAKRPVVVYHPRTPLDQLLLAKKTNGLSEKVMAFVAGLALILVLTFGFALIDPTQALAMYALAAVGVVGMCIMGYHFIYRPVAMRHQLIAKNWAVWVLPGEVREFYDTQAARIAAYVPEHHRMHVSTSLFLGIRHMVHQQEKLAQLSHAEASPAVIDDRRHEAAEYDNARQDALQAVNLYVEGEPPQQAG